MTYREGGLLIRTYFLAGRATRISQDGVVGCGKAMAKGAARAAAWTARWPRRVLSSARFVNPLAWRKRRASRRLQRERETRAAERRRIGHDLHDGVGQVLSGVAFMSRALEKKLAAKLGPRDNGTTAAAQIAEIAEEGMAQTRSTARLLDPVELEAGGLASALGRMASDFEKVFAGLGVRCTFERDERTVIESIGEDVLAAHLYRIAQEAATNAIRHGGARRVVIGLGLSDTDGERARLTVRDDGAGFAPPDALSAADRRAASAGGPDGADRRGASDGAADGPPDGMGLRIMEDRAKAIGGTLTVSRRPEGGILLSCTFPRRKKRR